MYKKKMMFLLAATVILPGFVQAGLPQSTERTMVGEWTVTSAPIDNQLFSRMGNTLGFPDRDMTFEEQDGLRTCFVARGELGRNVRPLGVWRVQGDRVSATFQLWCPEADDPCGTVMMRGRFVEDDKIKGTMTVFWDEPDPERPTGFDTWTMSFRGNRIR